MTTPANMADPFADPTVPASTFPTVASFRGRLAMFTVRKSEMKISQLNPGAGPKERLTVDVTVVDGLGAVPLLRGNPPQPTGQTLPGPDFTGVWIESERLVEQLRGQLGTGRPVLGVIDTRNPGTHPMKGNPWGLTAATEEQKAQARAYLANRSVAQAAAPEPVTQAAPQYATAPTVAPQPGPAAGAPTAPPAVPAPGSAAPGSNPFL